MIYAVNTSRNALAHRNAPAQVRARVMDITRRSSGARRALSTLRGLGVVGDMAPIDAAAMVAQDFASYDVGISSAVEAGTALSPDQVQALVTQDLNAMCSGTSWGQPGARCTVPADAIAQAAAAYAAALAAKKSQFAAEVAAGSVSPQGAYVQPADYPPAPAGSTGGGGNTAYATPAIAPAPTYPSPIQIDCSVYSPLSPLYAACLARKVATLAPTGATGGGAASTVAATPTQAVLRNISRPNMPLQAGDLFALDVQGAPNSPVKITATKNGGTPTTQDFGNTDGTGSRSITGGMSSSEVGSWIELIQVGSGAAYTLQFNVSPSAIKPSGQGASNTGAGGGGIQPSGAGGATGGGGSTSTDSSGTVGGSVVVQASATPSWVWIAAAAAAAFFFLGGKR